VTTPQPAASVRGQALACVRGEAGHDPSAVELQAETLLGLRRHLPVADSDAVASPALLAPSAPVVERWVGDRPVTAHRRGNARWRSDGCWLYGTLCVDERSVEGGLHAAAHRLYAELFEILREGRMPHLLRLWNYMAGITDPEAGMERYRRFNAGRQQAFIEADRSAFDGAPAACALGVERGPLTLHFLASTEKPIAVENPRQMSAYRYPSDYGPASPSFSRAARVAVDAGHEALFVSGTASIVGHATQHAGDVRLQAEESLRNLTAVIAAANRQRPAGTTGYRADQLECTWYLRRAEDLPAVREVFERVVGPASPAARRALYLRADICRPDLLVEIEGHAIIPSESA
jgi:hypothetical protein